MIYIKTARLLSINILKKNIMPVGGGWCTSRIYALDGSFIFITIDQVEKSSVKGKTPKLKSKYRFGTLRMSKPVTYIYMNRT
jgi:hypothetical protein